MPTPLYTALKALAARRPWRFHMPGHHGRPLPVPEFPGYSALDFTELPETGNLYEAGGPIEAAEDLWSAVFGMASCLFLTGGSTQGLLSALTLACPPGGALLVDRGCHRSVYHAMALLDLRPVYLARPWLSGPGVAGPISPGEVERALLAHPEVKTVCITSPTYYGVLSDIPALAAVVHARGGVLVVDGAHGAHLPFLGLSAYGGADLLVVSAHKTLPAPGQTALLFSGGAFSRGELRRAGQIYGTSSPSYPLMAALDLCRAHMAGPGGAGLRRAAEGVRSLRGAFPSLGEGDAPLDPCRFVWRVADGHGAQRALREEYRIYPEMADGAHVVFLLSAGEPSEAFSALTRALSALGGGDPGPSRAPAPPPVPAPAVSLRAALLSPRRLLPLSAAEGLTAAEAVCPYPPGVPVLAPGERVDKKHLSYLAQVGYNIENQIGVL